MSAAVSVAVSSAATSAAAAAAARARKAECVAITNNYDTKTATVEQARDYASCVYTLYGSGEPMDPTTAVLMKIAVALVLVGAAVGGIMGWREDGPLLSVVGFFLGACGVAIALFGLVAFSAGLNFIFS